MKNSLKTSVLAGALVVAAGAALVHAQITNEIKANITHSFMIGKKTMPPGRYTFRMQQDSNLALMTATNEDNNTSVAFSVREARDNHEPRHSELVFRKYGDTEFLAKIFEKGARLGSEVSESKSEEARVAQKMQPVEHTEEQK